MLDTAHLVQEVGRAGGAQRHGAAVPGRARGCAGRLEGRRGNPAPTVCLGRAPTRGSHATSTVVFLPSPTAPIARLPARTRSRRRPRLRSASCAGSIRGWDLGGSSTSCPAWGADRVPSRSAIHRCLRRHALIELRRRGKRRDEFRRWERDRPMQLWQMDVMGGVLRQDGTELKVVTGVDDHSRFCVAGRLGHEGDFQRQSARVLSASLRIHGIPDEILTDNGKVFTGRFGPRPLEVLFDRICRETASRTDTRPCARRRRPARSSGSIRACATSSWPIGPSTRSRPPRPSSTRGSPTTTPHDPTRPWRWPRRPSASA
jgi:integrase-like protein